LGVTPAGLGANQTAAPTAMQIDRDFMSAPHLKGLGAVGAAPAAAFIATLACLRLTRLAETIGFCRTGPRTRGWPATPRAKCRAGLAQGRRAGRDTPARPSCCIFRQDILATSMRRESRGTLVLLRRARVSGPNTGAPQRQKASLYNAHDQYNQLALRLPLGGSPALRRGGRDSPPLPVQAPHRGVGRAESAVDTTRLVRTRSGGYAPTDATTRT
jgi:hypothetical protein